MKLVNKVINLAKASKIKNNSLSLKSFTKFNLNSCLFFDQLVNFSLKTVYILSLLMLINCTVLIDSNVSANESVKIVNNFEMIAFDNKKVLDDFLDKNYRSPANFFPDEEMIILPYREEKTYIEKIHDKHAGELKGLKKRVQEWIMTEEFARNHGVEDISIYETSTPAQRRQFFERYYLRFFSKDFEKTTNDGLTYWWEQWTVDDEIETIDQTANRKAYLLSEQSGNSNINSLSKKNEISIDSKSKKYWSKFKIGTQPKIEQGAFLITMDTNIIDGRLFLAANGKHELTFERKIRAIRTRFLVNYYVESDRVIAAVDKKFNSNWSSRLTHEKNQYSKANLSTEDNRIQVNFSYPF